MLQHKKHGDEPKIKNKSRFHLSEKQKNIVFLLIFIFSFLSYIDLVFDVTLFKYVPLSDVFLQDRYHSQAINSIPFSDWHVDRSGMIRDVILNTILFFPFGFLLQMICKRNKICIYPIVIPLFVSVAIEVLQYIFSLGITDITDVISNTLGAILGSLSYLLFNTIFKEKKEKSNKILLLIIGIIAIINFSLSL